MKSKMYILYVRNDQFIEMKNVLKSNFSGKTFLVPGWIILE